MGLVWVSKPTVGSPGCAHRSGGGRTHPEDGAGIHLENGATATIQGNTISGNRDVGLFNATASVVDAQGNFWGVADGPSGGGFPSGLYFVRFQTEALAGSHRFEAVKKMILLR